MNYYNITTTVLAFLFLALFIRTFWNNSLKKLYENVKNRTKIDVKRKEAVKKGETPFYFERGAVVIYARTEARANHDYRKFKQKQKQEKREKLYKPKAK